MSTQEIDSCLDKLRYTIESQTNDLRRSTHAIKERDAQIKSLMEALNAEHTKVSAHSATIARLTQANESACNSMNKYLLDLQEERHKLKFWKDLCITIFVLAILIISLLTCIAFT